MSHTKGPWVVEETEDSYFILAGEDSDQIALIDKAFEPGNAELVAAAPDAVSIMEDLQEYLCEHGGPAVELLERVDAWLAKATGGAR